MVKLTARSQFGRPAAVALMATALSMVSCSAPQSIAEARLRADGAFDIPGLNEPVPAQSTSFRVDEIVDLNNQRYRRTEMTEASALRKAGFRVQDPEAVIRAFGAYYIPVQAQAELD